MANPSLNFSVAGNYGLWARFGGAVVITSDVVFLTGTAAAASVVTGFLTLTKPTSFVPAPQRTKAVRRLARTGNVM